MCECRHCQYAVSLVMSGFYEVAIIRSYIAKLSMENMACEMVLLYLSSPQADTCNHTIPKLTYVFSSCLTGPHITLDITNETAD